MKTIHLGNLTPTIRWAIYSLSTFASILFLFGDLLTQWSAWLGSIVFTAVYSIAWFLLAFKRLAMLRFKHPDNIALGCLSVMTVLTMILVPFTWYLEGFGADDPVSYLSDCKYLLLICMPFGIMAFEAQTQANQNESGIKVPKYRILVITAVCLFGFTGLKYFCKWLSIYSGDNYFVGFILLASISAGPILIALGLLLFYTWEHPKY